VAAFLTDAWFTQTNARLIAARAHIDDVEHRHLRVVLEIDGAPSSLARAMTFAVGPEAASLSPGGDPAPNLVVRVGFADAAALAGGSLDATTALSEGRLKVRGDVSALVELAGWLAAMHAATLKESR
jgi:hypothetical protein